MLARLGGRTFASLRHRDYRLYFAGSAISFIGTWMQQIAAYWLVLELTGSPIAVGALALVQTLPVTAFALVGGAIADRVDLRRMVIACETVLMLIAAVLAVLALADVIAGMAAVRPRLRPGHRARARRARAPHARLPDRRPGRPAERGRPQLGARDDGANHRAGARRDRRRDRRRGRRVRGERRELRGRDRRDHRDADHAPAERGRRGHVRPLGRRRDLPLRVRLDAA